MVKINYQFVEKNDVIQKQEESILRLLTVGKQIINEAQTYKKSVVSAAEQQAEFIVSQANAVAQEKEKQLLKAVESKRLEKEKQVQELDHQMLEIQAQIESLFANRYDILKMKNEELSD